MSLAVWGAALACATREEHRAPKDLSGSPEPKEEPDARAPESAPNARADSVRVTLRGFAIQKTKTDGSTVLELCPGTHFDAGCAGVRLLGEFPEGSISSAEWVAPMRVKGKYDGSAIRIEETARDVPSVKAGKTGQLKPADVNDLNTLVFERVRAAGAELLETSYNERTKQLEVKLEALDGALRRSIEEAASSKWSAASVKLSAFITLEDETLGELPFPPVRGDFPLWTGKVRSPQAMHQALGHFVLRVDRAQSCVYLQGEDPASARVLPSLPFGYAVFDDPLRLVDVEDRIVAREGELVPWGGSGAELTDKSLVPDSVPRCGATRFWHGVPQGKN